MAQYLEIEELDRLIKAVQDYHSDLNDNYMILKNAVNICDDAMGSDAISQKQIARLDGALKELKKVSQYASDMAEELKLDKIQALDVYYNS